MKKVIVAAMSALLVTFAASADVTVKLPSGQAKEKYAVMHNLTSDYSQPSKQRNPTFVDSVAVKDNVLEFAVDNSGNASYSIPIEGREAIQFYTSPGDNLKVDVKSLSPLEYTVTGSVLMNDISSLQPKAKELMMKYREIAKVEPRDEKGIEDAYNDIMNLYKGFMEKNPKSPAVIYAMLNALQGEDFLDAFNNLDESLKTTPLYPIAESQKKYVESRIAADKHRDELQSGNVYAPNFTFKDLEGKDVSLSDFKGKWVVIDFWGAWCPWCIKGFPKLKDAYEQYKSELEVIGVDCNDKEDAWRAAVKKYELPWVNVRNPLMGGESQILTDYAVQGFPTKVIVNPEGKIANITVGEDPGFFDTLAKLLNK